MLPILSKIISLVVGLSGALAAQHYEPYFLLKDTEQQWNILGYDILTVYPGDVVGVDYFTDIYQLRNYRVSNDTIYKDLVLLGRNHVTGADTSLIGVYAEYEGKVFFSSTGHYEGLKVPPAYQEEAYVLDYNAEVGDTLFRHGTDTGGTTYWILDSIGTLALSDSSMVPRYYTSRHVYEWRSGYYFHDTTEIKSFSPAIGDLWKGLNFQVANFGNQWAFARTLLGYFENGELRYSNNDEEKYLVTERIPLEGLEHVPLLPDGISKEWSYRQYFDRFGPVPDTMTTRYRMAERTNIAGEEWSIMERYRDSVYVPETAEVMAYWREEGDSIFFYDPQNPLHQPEEPVLDFSVDFGDTLFRFTDPGGVFHFGVLAHKYPIDFWDGRPRLQYQLMHFTRENDLTIFKVGPLVITDEVLDELYTGRSVLDLLLGNQAQEYFRCYQENGMLTHLEYDPWEPPGAARCYVNTLSSSTEDFSTESEWPLNLFPNPVRESLWLDQLPSGGSFIYQLFDARSVRLEIGELLVSDGERGQIPVDHLPSGIYYLRLSTKGDIGGITRKFVKH